MSKFYENITESLWSDLQDRSSGDVVRKEDDVNHLDKDDFYDYIKSHYEFTEYETKFTCGYELIAIPLFTTSYSLRYTLFNVPEHRVEMYESLFEKWPTYLQTVLREKYNVESVENERGDIMTYITQKDGESDNKFLLDFIDTIINNVEKPVIRRKTNESLWADLQDRSSGDIIRKEDEVSYSTLEDEDCTVDLLYKYLIENYEVLGNDKIILNSGEYSGNVWYEVHVPITLSGDNIETEIAGEDQKSIWSIDFTVRLKKYVKKMKTVEEIDDENINSDTYARAYTYTNPVLCSEVVDFIDEILTMVPDPALKKKPVNESLWSDLQDRSSGDVVRKEDVPLTDDELKELDQYITDYGNEVVLGWGRGSDACNLDEFIDYLKTDRKIDDRILKYVKDNWFDEICDDVDASIEQSQKEWHQDMYESLWSDLQDRSSGDVVRKEDDVLTDQEINSLNQFTLMYCRGERAHYIQNHIVPPPPSRRKENDYEGLIKYIEDRRDENMFTNVGDYNKIIRYIKKNWDKLDMDTYIKKWICSPDVMKGTKIVECDGVPGGLTPADVGGMGEISFPGPDGTPGSGDIPMPTGVVYHQVAPFGLFIKDLKKKKKKKKFRIEDEPCAHSKNSKTYNYVDDFRDYVDRTYNNIDKRK